MSDSTKARTLDLGQGDFLHLPCARGSVVRVRRGEVWLTEHGDPRDVLLGAGDAWVVEHGGLALLEAREGSTVTVSGPAAQRAHPHRRHAAPGSSIARLLRRWLTQRPAGAGA